MHNDNGCVALETNNGANNIKIERPYLYPHAIVAYSRIIKRTDIISRNSFQTEKRLLQYRNPNTCITKAIHLTDGRSKVIYCHLSDLTCRIRYCRPFIFLAERASLEREMVILAPPLTIKGENIDRKQ